MSVRPFLRLSVGLLLLGACGCIYTVHRTAATELDPSRTGRPFAWDAHEKAFVFTERALVTYQRASVYPVGFRFFSGEDLRPFEAIVRFPTWLFELPFAWEERTPYDISVIDRTPRARAVVIRDLPYYGHRADERFGATVLRSFADPMFGAYHRLFAKEIDFDKGDAALAAAPGPHDVQRRLYLRTYERWLADHIPVLAWVDRDGGENLLLRREKGLDHYRDLKFVRTIKVVVPPDTAFDTLDGEHVYAFFHGWAENRYFDAISTSRKGSSIGTLIDLAKGEEHPFGHYDDVPTAGELPDGVELRIVSQTPEN